MSGESAIPDLVDELRRRRFREESRDHRAHELIGRQIGYLQALPQALFDDLSRKGAGPPRIGAGEHQRHWDRGVPTVELEAKRSAERQPGHVRPPKAERVNESGEAVRVVRHAERLAWIR